MSKYTVDYFIEKFINIPAKQYFMQEFINPINPDQRCALGHCGMRYIDTLTEEAAALWELLGIKNSPVAINDGLDRRYKQPTPKARILAALLDVKAGVV